MNVYLVLLKIAGAILVTAAGGIAGFTLAKGIESGQRELERLEAALVLLSGEISYSLTPLPYALSRCGTKVGGHTGLLFERFGELTGSARHLGASEALEEALLDFGEGVPAGSREILTDLSRNLGVSGHKEQERYIDISINRAKRLREESSAESRARAKLYRYLGLLGGVGIAIVLM